MKCSIVQMFNVQSTECSFKFDIRFLKQVDRCTAITFSDIYKVKMENNTVIPSKPFRQIVIEGFVHNIYNRRKTGDNVLFNQLNNYHPDIQLIT